MRSKHGRKRHKHKGRRNKAQRKYSRKGKIGLNKKHSKKKTQKKKKSPRSQPLSKQRAHSQKSTTPNNTEGRVYGGIMDPASWSPDGVDWCRASKFRSVLFVDECLVLSGISVKTLVRIQGESCRVLKFPTKYIKTGRKDPDVLVSILEFISNNDILIKRKLKLCFVTFDDNFREDSLANSQFEKYGFEIHLLVLNVSNLVALELQRFLNQKPLRLNI